MNKPHKVVTFFLSFLLIICFLNTNIVASSEIDPELQEKVNEAYNAINAASKNAEELSDLIASLNQVFEKYNTGKIDESEAYSILDQIIENAYVTEQQGIQQNTQRLGLVAINTVVVAALSFLMWKSFPKLYWRTWIKLRGHWRVQE